MGTEKSILGSYLTLNLVCSRPIALGVYDHKNQVREKTYDWFSLKYKGKIFARDIEAMTKLELSFQDRILEMTESNSIIVAVMKYASANIT